MTPLERNRVGVYFDISEGQVARIKQINIVGNKAYEDSELLDLFELRPRGMLTWIGQAERYSKQKLGADLATLRS